MMRPSKLSCLAAAACALAAGLAQAGGPLGVCNSAPLAYAAPGTINLNYDGGGTLGSRSKAQADAIVTAAASRWTNVGTATVTLGRGSDLPVDVTVANYPTYFNSMSDGLNPVIYDTDGSIVDTLLGVGASKSVLGFAGSGWFGAPTCRYAEGRAVINGAIAVSDATMTTVLAHELGHLIGLDHTQLDTDQGLASSNFPLMYPIAYRTLSTLHEDDVAAVSALYPASTVAGTYGTLSGTFTLAGGSTPVRGANIWARDEASGRVFSSVSDYLMQNNGAFRMLLPPGSYTLHAEAIASDFNGGSSVGPYADTYPSDTSFQPPLYVNGVAMAPLTLGNGSPTRIAISAGCSATASFRFDGSGSVGGNCATSTPPPATGGSRLYGLSTRMQVLTGNNVLIGGFVVGGTAPKTVVVRARGPSLAAQGITGTLANPSLQLVRASDNATIGLNDDWGASANAAQIAASGFAPSDALEAAVMMTLAPGAYTAIVSGTGGSTGVGIVEVYEVDHPEIPLTGISTRGQVLTANDVMIGGFVIQGSTAQTVVVRARGPSLAAQGVAGALANPTLQLVRASDNTTVAINDDWGTAANAAQLSASGYAPTDARESAILVTLSPGAYTAIVSGAGGTTGVGIVEVYAQ
ncbi:MAG: matrixin family metalloprotease [Betaproteobacteria bacterium]